MVKCSDARTNTVVWLIALLLHHQVAGQRIVIKHTASEGQAIGKHAQQQGLTLLLQGRGLTVVQAKSSQTSQPTALKKLLANVRTWPGVSYAEEDQPRYMHRPLTDSLTATAAKAAQGGPTPPVNCVEWDTPISNNTFPEYIPYGIRQIQGTSPKLPNRTDDAGVILCLIDSGLDVGHPDFAGNKLDGCKYEDPFAPAGCPFIWGQDFVGHGTHITGTIAAQKNGVGVVGVIPGPAEVYVVRVFNDSGDVNQGQGLVYGSTLILAFTQCEGRLSAMQASYPAKRYRMVVSMSLGAPGPLTLEKMYFREAAQRGDTLFVASAGNNGTSPTLVNGKLSTDVNPGNYPGNYPEVIAVSAVDCTNRLAGFSQKNPQVDLAAPGVDILSISSHSIRSKAGFMSAAFISLQTPRLTIPAGIGNSEGQVRQVRWSGIGNFTGKVADCGLGDKPCSAAKDAICLIQYDPKLKSADVSPANYIAPGLGAADWQPRPMPQRTPAPQQDCSTTSQSPKPSSISTTPNSTSQNRKSNSILPVLPWGSRVPTKYACDAMEYCMQQGAKAMLIAPPALESGHYDPLGLKEPGAVQEGPYYTTLNCTAQNCTCWSRLQQVNATNRLPAVGIRLLEYDDLRQAAKAAVEANKQVTGTVQAQVDTYSRLSGTSMAVPHVSGAIARVWAAYPNCKAATVRAAFEQAALDLGPKGKDVQFGYGLIQAEASFDYLARQPCAKGKTDD